MRKKNYATPSETIANYVENLLNLQGDVELNFVLEHAKKRGTPPLQIIPSDARHLEVLARLAKPTRILEIGTLCGYSAVCLSRALKAGGKLLTCERSTHHADVAREVFELLNLSDKIELVFGEAKDNFSYLEKHGPFDIIFIDADKENYPLYFDWAKDKLTNGGLLIADNVFVFGNIGTAPTPEGKLGELVCAMDNFNKKCAESGEFVSTFFPTGEGLMVAVKK